MLKCRDVARQGSDYLDQNQSLMQRVNVAFHLFMCGKCRLFIRHLRTSLQFYRKLPFRQLDDVAAATLAEHVISRDQASPEGEH